MGLKDQTSARSIHVILVADSDRKKKMKKVYNIKFKLSNL
jgi:hypothetical protein